MSVNTEPRIYLCWIAKCGVPLDSSQSQFTSGVDIVFIWVRIEREIYSPQFLFHFPHSFIISYTFPYICLTWAHCFRSKSVNAVIPTTPLSMYIHSLFVQFEIRGIKGTPYTFFLQFTHTYRTDNGKRFVTGGQRWIIQSQQDDGRVDQDAADRYDVAQFGAGQLNASVNVGGETSGSVWCGNRQLKWKFENGGKWFEIGLFGECDICVCMCVNWELFRFLKCIQKKQST